MGERRGRIPVAKFRTKEQIARARSRVREDNYNEINPTDCDNFTLLEEIIALKEHNKSLKEDLNKSNLQNEQLKKRILTNNSESAENIQIKNKFYQLKTTLTSCLNRIGYTDQKNIEETNDMKVFSENLNKLCDDFLNIKSSYNNLELQLYEANEKNADLVEMNNQSKREMTISQTNQTRYSESGNFENCSQSIATGSTQIDCKKETVISDIIKQKDETGEMMMEMVITI